MIIFEDDFGSTETTEFTQVLGQLYAISKEKKKVKLNKPFRTPDGPKKFGVYVKNDKGNIVLVRFGSNDSGMDIKRDDPNRKKSFRARHNCSSPGPRWKARYWSCKMWGNKKVTDIL